MQCLDLLKLLSLLIEIYGKKHLLISNKDNHYFFFERFLNQTYKNILKIPLSNSPVSKDR